MSVRPVASRVSQRQVVVWGFPIGYNPNLAGPDCDRCGKRQWQGRQCGPDQVAWTCIPCSLVTSRVPLPIPD